eukprot:TRINITY_DN24364_c0_g1_i1.p1 TRINITY_DN24364_c0_g1~~TRINITY_DN24364_c0_g1_i1.p1  ORF type:complete len:600 (+),score=97.96 TRINITY_DN24364_c0_g1_i1:117-1916(+)
MKAFERKPSGLTAVEVKDELHKQLTDLRRDLVQDLLQVLQSQVVMRFPLPTVQEAEETPSQDEERKRSAGFQDGYDSLREVARRGFKRGHLVNDEQRMQLHAMSRSNVSEDFVPNGGLPFTNDDDVALHKKVQSRENDRRTILVYEDSEDESDQGPQTIYSHFSRIIASNNYSYFVSLMVVLNSIQIGFETDYLAQHGGTEKMPYAVVFDKTFCWVFTLELLARMLTQSLSKFFCGDEWGWNCFDFFIVGMQWFEAIAGLFGEPDDHAGGTMQLGFLKTLRVVRIMRLARVIKFIVELRTMISCIIGSLRPLFWACVLFIMIIYGVAVSLTQVVNDYRRVNADAPDIESLERFFNSVPVAGLALWECISGGMDWQDLADPLMRHISPMFAVLLSIYVAFSVLAMMNVITGIFVDNATKYAQQDEDANIAKHVLSLFRRSDLTAEGLISWDVFQDKLVSGELQMLFEAVEVDPEDAQSLFNLLNADSNSGISPQELLYGWARLRGTAKALDVALLMRKVTEDNQFAIHSRDDMTQKLDWLCDKFGGRPAVNRKSEQRAGARRQKRKSMVGARSMPPVSSYNGGGGGGEYGYQPIAQEAQE